MLTSWQKEKKNQEIWQEVRMCHVPRVTGQVTWPSPTPLGGYIYSLPTGM